MITFYKGQFDQYFLVQSRTSLTVEDQSKLSWLFKGATCLSESILKGPFIGSRVEMISPWSTNAVEIAKNMGIAEIERIEVFQKVTTENSEYDPMLQTLYLEITNTIFDIPNDPDPIVFIDDIATYNQDEGLALSQDEILYLQAIEKKLNRKLTDTEVFGFSQINSEHCRHKIFNGTFIIDGKEQKESLFQLIKKTTKKNLNRVVSAYKDNVAFFKGDVAYQFAPRCSEVADFFEVTPIDTVLSIKAETHNFPTTVEPFYGAATGSGGEIRDRMAGGKASIPLAGTAVYMTAYSRITKQAWQNKMPARKWLYQNPSDILIKASNGASDFGNKFGQPLICGSVLTFEHEESDISYGYDKVIMLAGGIGYANAKDALKDQPEKGDKVIVMGGDNYRIGMGGGAVSSVATGEYNSKLELNAIQRANPEMQKRAYNVIRALAERGKNPIVSIHDHGAGGHLNCLTELLEDNGGIIHVNKLPVGDPTLSAKEILGNESQERMGFVIKEKDISLAETIAKRERAPFYVVGDVHDTKHIQCIDEDNQKSVDMPLDYLFGDPPKTVLNDQRISTQFNEISYDADQIEGYLQQVLSLEAVGAKDWLTNKVDRSVTGKVATQQTVGPLQLPLNNVGVATIDYTGTKGVATTIGHAPVPGLIDAKNGAMLSIAESLTNIVFTPISDGLSGISLSANWMWPAKNKGEDARLYDAVKAVSDFSCELGINVPTGKDSLSMTQKYPDGKVVYSPGTVIISAVGQVSDIQKTVTPMLSGKIDTTLIYIDFSGDNFPLGGSSFAQICGQLGTQVPQITASSYFKVAFQTIQALIDKQLILAGHDISAGGLITTLLEMTFSRNDIGLSIDLSAFKTVDFASILFSEQPGIVIEVSREHCEKVITSLNQSNIQYHLIGQPISSQTLRLQKDADQLTLDIPTYRDHWYHTSYLLDQMQSGAQCAKERYQNYAKQPLQFQFPSQFDGQLDADLSPIRKEKTGVNAAIIREKGVNGDREMAYALFLAGFDVKDVHMTDLISGQETLEDVNLIVFVGGFSNSDVLGSAKGWAGAFLYNAKAKQALDHFYSRKDTLSLGVCNGCQLMVELGLITQDIDIPTMDHNVSHKFESSFLSVEIPENESVMLKSLAGTKLGIWVAHGEGRFILKKDMGSYHIPIKYAYDAYPGNPNGSDYSAAGICSADGRHLAMMPHLERAILPWQWGHYSDERKKDQVTPWLDAFINAKNWVVQNRV